MKKYLLYIILGILIYISITPIHEFGHFIIAKTYKMEIIDICWFKFELFPPSLGMGSISVLYESIPNRKADYYLSIAGPIFELAYCITIIIIGLKKKWWWLFVPPQLALSWLPIYAINDLNDFYPNLWKNSILIYTVYFSSFLIYIIPLRNLLQLRKFSSEITTIDDKEDGS